jgi:hypothetical protein
MRFDTHTEFEICTIIQINTNSNNCKTMQEVLILH